MTTAKNHHHTRPHFLLFALLLAGSTCAALGQTNQVLSLDGLGGHMSVPSADDLQNPTEIAVEAWVYPVDTGTRVYFIMKGDAGSAVSERSYELSWQPGTGINNLTFSVFLGVDTWGAVGAPAPAEGWVHVAGTCSSTDSVLSMYTNGVLAAETTTDASGNAPLNHQLAPNPRKPPPKSDIRLAVVY